MLIVSIGGLELMDIEWLLIQMENYLLIEQITMKVVLLLVWLLETAILVYIGKLMEL